MHKNKEYLYHESIQFSSKIVVCMYLLYTAVFLFNTGPSNSWFQNDNILQQISYSFVKKQKSNLPILATALKKESKKDRLIRWCGKWKHVKLNQRLDHKI